MVNRKPRTRTRHHGKAGSAGVRTRTTSQRRIRNATDEAVKCIASAPRWKIRAHAIPALNGKPWGICYSPPFGLPPARGRPPYAKRDQLDGRGAIGSSFQMSRLYSRIVRSVENQPLRAVVEDAHARPSLGIPIGRATRGAGHRHKLRKSAAVIQGSWGLRMAPLMASKMPGSNWLKWPLSIICITRRRSSSASMIPFGS